MTVERLYPSPGNCDLTEALAEFRATAQPLEPFAPDTIRFCAAFSRRLFRDPQTQRYPELLSLGFWMREAAITQLRDSFLGGQGGATVAVPRGVVFHVPPANVDTIFVYSWLLALLCGNTNLIRLSRRVSPQTNLLLDAFRHTAAETGAALQSNTLILRYGHEREITEALSLASDVRMIWGGDGTVNAIRAAALRPHARDIAFPDRYSFAVMRAAAYLALDAAQRQDIAHRFYNDIFWFDQMACSSPHLLVWMGGAEESAEAGKLFFSTLAAYLAQRGHQTEIATRLEKFTFACRAILDSRVSNLLDTAQISMLTATELDAGLRTYTGGGFLYQFAAPSLDAVNGFVERRDQTVTAFGFSASELRQWAVSLRGRGVDRIVPIGRALNFDRYWDGYDLLYELTRHVRVESDLA